MKGITEDHLEGATLAWLAALGWETGHGPDASPLDAKTPGTERDRYRDVVLFLNGLPVVVLELKNPGDENADLWAAFNQLQAYKEDIPDLFDSIADRAQEANSPGEPTEA